ncbi:MAG: T9SS type A sorting domain-containing protein [Melioribacteraceae bacterium]|nr:T9SS type A sorting domain-containing protein [Melioribacteraceae bacterium]
MKKLIFILVIIGLSSLSAQSFIKHFALPTNEIYSLKDSLKILAVMVEFKEDKYDATIGNGKFGSHYTKNYGDTILDPLPHDASYFEDHLLFAKNYFYKVSKGKLNISYKVLPEVITVSKTMREYSPGYQSKDLKPLVDLSEEVWKIADQKFSNINFSNYDLFIIFHAGVSSGLDIGIFSIDRNLPSLYLGFNTFQKIKGIQFNGFQTRSGLIKNTMIMPETESRELQMIDNSTYLLQLTINGTLVANISSHLGLPDLFDTETGKSAIGRFGLMDGQAIIANNGMFPPSMSAWEKIYLGWDSPKIILKNSKNINVTSSEIASVSDSTIIKIPINSSEYFLVENRQQDAKKNDLILTIKNRNKIYQKVIKPDTSGLYYVQPSDVKGGVVIDVDEFDAATPGNGIVIWHIDENIINKKISENKINSDLYNKGVDVEEADGIQDIGETFSSIFGSFIGEGEKNDYWFKGNKSKFYRNLFSVDTKPNTNSNSNAKSYITLDSFSDNKNKMSFNVSFGNDLIKKVFETKLNFIQSDKNELITLRNNNSLDYFLTDDKDIVKIASDGKILNRLKNFTDQNRIAGIVFDGIQYLVGSLNEIINVYSFNLFTKEEKISSFKSLYAITTPLVLVNQSNGLQLNAGSQNGYLISIQINDIVNGKVSNVNYQNITNGSLLQINREYNSINTKYFSAISNNEFYQSNLNISNQLVNRNFKRNVLIKNSNGEYVNVALSDYLGKNHFDVILQDKPKYSFDFLNNIQSNNFSVADLFNDGRLLIIINNGSELVVLNENGTVIENFPLSAGDNKKFIGTPFIVDLNKDGIQEILITNNLGELNVYNVKDGKIFSGFPVKITNTEIVNSFLYEEELPTMGPIPQYKPLLISIDKQKNFSVWQLSGFQGKSFWKSNFSNSTNNSFIELTNKQQTISEYFPLEKAYNWPNPVYGNTTNIRFYVSEESKVKIRIFDLAGATISTIELNANGGIENEVVWDVSKVSSGIYYANIQTESLSGKTASKNIKIAVIK